MEQISSSEGFYPGFQTSQTTEKLDTALAKAQGEILVAKKDSINPHFKSKYADLASVWQACRSALSKHGIAVTQWPIHSTDNRLHILTRLACDGQWMICHFSLPVIKGDAHGYGSATTYGKRFALSAAVGVASDEDDDGNAASVTPPQSGELRVAVSNAVSARKAEEKQSTTSTGSPSPWEQMQVIGRDAGMKVAEVGKLAIDLTGKKKTSEFTAEDVEKVKAAIKT